MRGSTLLILALASLALVPVGLSVRAQQRQASDYFPLALGDRWTYVVSSGTQKVVLDAVIDSAETVGDVQCHVRALALQQGNQRECYAWSGDRLYLYKTEVDFQVYINHPPLLSLDSPLETGHKWTYQGEVQGENGNVVTATENFEVIGPAKVDVPAGTFDAIEIRVTHTNSIFLTGTRWFALGIGLVKEVSSQQGTTTTVELKSFQVANEQSTSTSQELTATQTQYTNSLTAVASFGLAAFGSIVLVAYMLRRKSNVRQTFSKTRLLGTVLLLGIALASTSLLTYPSIPHVASQVSITSSTSASTLVSYSSHLITTIVDISTTGQVCQKGECTQRILITSSYSSFYTSEQLSSTRYITDKYTATSFRSETLAPYAAYGISSTNLSFATVVEYAVLGGIVALFLRGDKKTQVTRQSSPKNRRVSRLRNPRILALVAVVLFVAGIALLFSGASQGLSGSPPVDIDYANSRLVYQSDLYYDRIALYNHGSEQVSVVVSIKTGLDFSPRTSNPVQICAGCTATVLILEEQPGPNQTPDQYAHMANFMTHPDSLIVYYAPSSTAETNVPEVLSGIILTLVGISLAVYTFRDKIREIRRTRYEPDYYEPPPEEYDYQDEPHEYASEEDEEP